jgi:hypothetical protein
MKLKTDKLLVSVYARHGDMCGLADSYGHHDSLGCATGLKEWDYVLVAKFAYLQEAIEYCQEASARGVRVRLVSRIVGGAAPYVSDYPKGNVGSALDAVHAQYVADSKL